MFASSTRSTCWQQYDLGHRRRGGGGRHLARIFGFASSDEVLIRYLAVKAHREACRWAVRRLGSPGAVRIGTETFANEVDAAKTGRPALIATCAACRRMRRRASAS